MRRALSLARKAWGRTSPNPMVGAVVTKDGHIIGEGFHAKAGEPHAEVNALRSCGADSADSTIYITLEPCSTHGRTPPCVDALLAAKVRRVVVGTLDPNPQHAGRGVEILQGKGIEVITGVMESECRLLNESFFHWIVDKTPFVLLKLATTLDGKIATRDGQSKWITSPMARRRVQRLRQWADAILVGGRTVRADHPSLMVRGVEGWSQPRRLVATRTLAAEELTSLMGAGPAPESVSANSFEEWRGLMRRLGAENVTALLVEGGGDLAAELLRAGVVHKVEFHMAPKILGGARSITGVGGADPASLAEAIELSSLSVRKCGPDLIVSGYAAGDKPQTP